MAKEAFSFARHVRRTNPCVELGFEPLSEALPRWRNLLESTLDATLYHREAWLKALERAYRLKLYVMTLNARTEVLAGGVFALTGFRFLSRMTSLPFSDWCPPLCTDDGARTRMLDALSLSPPASRVEIRGIEGTGPWSTERCFERWTLDLARPATLIMRGVSRNFRSNAKRAATFQVHVEKGSSRDYVRRFYRLQLETRQRLGLPPQPLKFFMAVRDEFAALNNVEIWIAASQGRDLAALFVLRDGANLHCKWSARSTDGIQGATHLVNLSLIEEHANRASTLELGRADQRNAGLVRFKHELGARPIALPYTYFPKAPLSQSSEAMSPLLRSVSQLWRRLPQPVTQILGASLYRFLA